MTYVNPQGIYIDPLSYDNRSGSLLQQRMQSVWRPALRKVIDKYINRPSTVICDLGCGTLEYSQHLTRVARIYAVDNNRSMIEYGKLKVNRLKAKIHYLVKDCLNTTIPSGECNAVICVGLSEFVDLNRLWSEINRISATDSIILFSFPNKNNPLIIMEHFYQKYIRRKFVKNLYSLDQIRKIAKLYNYRIKESNNLGALYWVPRTLEKYFSWSWPILERLNTTICRVFPLGAYTYLVFVRQII